MIILDHVCKTFVGTDGQVEALKDVSLTVPDGDIYGIIGMSGAGKSTLVRTVNLLEKPTSGTVLVDGVDMTKLSPAELRKKRREITMIFQSFNLLMQKNCLKNVCFPLELAGMKSREAKAKALELLELVGLKDKASAYPAQLSGGQQQRVAIARALATEPKVLLCDEVTSALDVSVQAQVINLLNDLRDELGLTILFIAHDLSVVKYFSDRIGVMYYGHMVELADSDELFKHPIHPYTRSLLSAIPLPDPHFEKQRVRIVYNPIADHDYSEQGPTFREIIPGHFVSCNDAEEAKYREEFGL